MSLRERVYTLVVFVFYSTINAEGIWRAVPKEHVDVMKGNPLSLHWHYEMDKDQTFLSSEITISENGQLLHIAARYGHHKSYVKKEKFKMENSSVSIFGKNNVTLIAQSDTIGYDVVYCCVVNWETVEGTNSIQTKRKCSTVSVYDLPRITHHTSELSCKQGDSVTLQCNATGYPEIRIVWTHNNKLFSAVFNITGKKSEGNYCCDAKNDFGRKTACTAVNVTEYGPEDTYILVSRSYRRNVNVFNITCKAVASPPANKFIITTDNEEHNSPDGVKAFIIKPTKKDIVIRCVPYNKYGMGPRKEVIFPLHVPPSFPNLMRTQYNMTIREITIECHATGSPVPSLRWTRADTGEIVSTNENYTIPYIKCANKKMIFVCHAANVMGTVNSSKIVVTVMTQQCSTTDRDVTRSMNYSMAVHITIGSAGLLIFIGMICIFYKVTMNRTRKDTKEKEIDENPYQEPIDHAALSEENLLDRNALRDEDGYATLEDCGLKYFEYTKAIPPKDAHKTDVAQFFLHKKP